MTVSYKDPVDILKQYWRTSPDLDGKQLQAITSLLQGKDVLFLAPTRIR